jgi:hypothetical protein
LPAAGNANHEVVRVPVAADIFQDVASPGVEPPALVTTKTVTP